MARTTYTAYENGTKMPPPDTINNIAILLDVSNDYLMGRTDTPYTYEENTLERFTMLPVVSKIPSEEDALFNDIQTYFPVEKSLIGTGEYVWLNIMGDSMINVGIRKGSKVLIHLMAAVDNGDIAAVCMNGADAVLKKVYFTDEKITLVSENPSFSDQVYEKDEVMIKGKAIYVSGVLSV